MSGGSLRPLSKKWPEGKVLYKYHSSLSAKVKRLIQRAMGDWSSKTCIVFTEITNNSASRGEDHVTITSEGSGCSTECPGYCMRGSKLNLETPQCVKTGTILHELGHVIGLWHEQNRPDRDKFVQINIENVRPDLKTNFYKRSLQEIDSEGLVYNFGSIMHYNEYSFSRNGNKTLEVTNQKVYREQGSPVVGQRKRLSRGDIEVVNRMYSCPGKHNYPLL